MHLLTSTAFTPPPLILKSLRIAFHQQLFKSLSFCGLIASPLAGVLILAFSLISIPGTLWEKTRKYPVLSLAMFLGLPGPVWAMLGVDFVEHLGYYAVAFSLFTYCTVMLKTSVTAANAITNFMYILIPAAAFFSSGVADSLVSRPRVLMYSLVLYTASLLVLFLSATPAFYADFPANPQWTSHFLFWVALLGFSVGYGSMKVCTNPMMADCITNFYTRSSPLSATPTAVLGDTSGKDTPEDAATMPAAAAAAVASEVLGTSERRSLPNGGSPCALADATTLCERTEPWESDGSRSAHAQPTLITLEGADYGGSSLSLDQALTRLFIYSYWVANVGGLIGSFVAPMLRDIDPRTVTDTSLESASTGYYYSFFFATVAVGCGLAAFSAFYALYPKNRAAPLFIFFRILCKAVFRWIAVVSGRMALSPYELDSKPWRDWLSYAEFRIFPAEQIRGITGRGLATDITIEETHPISPSSTAALPVSPESSGSADKRENRGDESPALSPPAEYSGDPLGEANTSADADWMERFPFEDASVCQYVDDCRTTLSVCQAFVALPIYWLICNQFSTNLMYQASALQLPSSVPVEYFNNINTATMLIFLTLWDRLILPHVLHGKVPAACYRVVSGFLLMCLSMVWCGVLQVAICQRGDYDDKDVYVLRDGAVRLSGGWLIVPYVLQGLSSAMVDSTVMEVAYIGAPECMKGTVMGLYWVASSASGVLGLSLSPVMKPKNATALFFSFAVAQFLVSGVFFALNRKKNYGMVAPSS